MSRSSAMWSAAVASALIVLVLGAVVLRPQLGAATSAASTNPVFVAASDTFAGDGVSTWHDDWDWDDYDDDDDDHHDDDHDDDDDDDRRRHRDH